MLFELRLFKIFEHAVDSCAEISEFVRAADRQTSRKIAARSDVGDPIAQLGDARKYYAFQEEKGSGAE